MPHSVWSSFQSAGATPPNAAGPPNEMAEAASQWARHVELTPAQAAQYASQQAQMATNSAQNAVAQVSYLMNNPDLRSAAAASFVDESGSLFSSPALLLETCRQVITSTGRRRSRKMDSFI
eukprot:symbB.v1.2.015140.t1/scaffold1124.1/size136573/6